MNREHPTVCMHCDSDIWPEDYHWYDKINPEHCFYCAPETCHTCKVRRENHFRSVEEQELSDEPDEVQRALIEAMTHDK